MNLKTTPSRRQKFLRRLKALLLAAIGSGVAGTAMAQAVVNPISRDSIAPVPPLTPVQPGAPANPANPGDATRPAPADPGTPPASGTPTPISTEIRAEIAYFLAVGQRGSNGPESYVVPVNGAARIAEVREYLADRAEGRETRPLIPSVFLRLGNDGQNRNHSAPGAPLWPWHVGEVRSFTRYTWPEIEPAVFIPTRDSTLGEIENYLRGDPLTLQASIFFLRGYPIVMELRSEFPTARTATLANISDRGFVGTGNDAKITGFVIEGETPRNVVVRALGPTLARFGVTNALANPRLEVYRGTEKIADNDDWAAGNLNRPHVTVLAGAPGPLNLIPNDDREPALELSLAPGAYTIVVTGVGGTTGVVLTEVHTF